MYIRPPNGTGITQGCDKAEINQCFGQHMENFILVAAKPAAQPAAGEPIPVAPVEHVLFRVKYSRQKKWHTEPVSEWN